ncbi:MAG: glycerophosphodiester phosphodiesterase [Sciscionella sp.]|nr:glycerophosphodiester phosphodiesterase [Sciscionella sp.]
MQPLVVAHRGASAERAEHTLDAYSLALQQDADGVECDVRLTSDGHLVCVHDRRIDRTSTGTGVVSELTLRQMSGLNFSQWHDDLPDSADELVLSAGDCSGAHRESGPLTLAALLGLLADHRTDTTLFVETKHPVRYAGLVEVELVALLRRHGLLNPKSKVDSRVVAMSFSSRAMRRIRGLAPLLPTVLLLPQSRPLRRDGALPAWIDIAGPSIARLRDDPDYVARTAARGHDTYCWTVDEPDDLRLCAKLGVRFSATNTPAAARKVLADC